MPSLWVEDYHDWSWTVWESFAWLGWTQQISLGPLIIWNASMVGYRHGARHNPRYYWYAHARYIFLGKQGMYKVHFLKLIFPQIRNQPNQSHDSPTVRLSVWKMISFIFVKKPPGKYTYWSRRRKLTCKRKTWEETEGLTGIRFWFWFILKLKGTFIIRMY